MEQVAQIVHITKELSGRWTIPILLSLEESGGRFTPLKNNLQIAPSRLSSNLKMMTEAGLVQHLSPFERNHPLLPEYQLTEKGRFMKEAALVISSSEHQMSRGFLAAKAWNWPVLIASTFITMNLMLYVNCCKRQPRVFSQHGLANFTQKT